MFIEVKMYDEFENKDCELKMILNLDCIIRIVKCKKEKWSFYSLYDGQCNWSLSEETGLKIIELLKKTKC